MSKNPPDIGDGVVGGKDSYPSKKQHLANVWYSWQGFQVTLRNVVESEWKHKKEDITGYITQICELFEFVSIKLLFISAVPLMMYLTIFNRYLVLKDLLNLPEKPHLVLPTIEQYIFQCLPHQVMSRRNNVVLDVLAALPYLLHFALPFLFVVYVTIVRRARGVPLIYQYMWCVGWTNMVSVCMQFLLPTAPPWFNDSAVFDEVDGSILSAAPNEAAFQRIDALIGFPFFHHIYGQSPLKYGSFPSLHVAWPMVILVHEPWIGTTVGALHVLWITWAALYSSHHYLIDCIGGISIVIIVKLCMIHIWEPFSQKKRSKEPIRPSYQRLTSCSKAV